MNDHTELHNRAKQIAQKHLYEVEELPTPVLIEKLETLAYQIAREGDNREATELFMLVAELSTETASRRHENTKSNTAANTSQEMEDGND